MEPMDKRGVINWAVAHFKAVMGVLVGGCVALLIGIIAVNAYNNYSPSKTLLDLNIAPLSSKITLDGIAISQGTNEVEAGSHHLAFSADGFDSKEYDIEVKSNQTNSITDFLYNTENGLKYYEANDAEMDVLRASNNEEAKQFAAAFDKKISIRTDLPIDVEYGEIGAYLAMTVEFGYGAEPCQTRLCLLVDTHDTEEARQALSLALSERGYNLADYEVIYDGK